MHDSVKKSFNSFTTSIELPNWPKFCGQDTMWTPVLMLSKVKLHMQCIKKLLVESCNKTSS